LSLIEKEKIPSKKETKNITLPYQTNQGFKDVNIANHCKISNYIQLILKTNFAAKIIIL
jgi:hypothetical protein